MDIFKIFGTIAINGVKETQKDIEDTAKTAEQASGVLEKVGEVIKESFEDEHVKDFEDSVDSLNHSISDQQKRLDSLKNKYSDLYLAQGETSKEAQDCAREIEKLSAELKENTDALNDAKRAADKFDKTLEDVGEESRETGGAGQSLRDKWSGAIGQFKTSHPVLTKVAAGVTAVGAAIIAATKAMIELADSTREYRLEMGKLDTAFANAGHTTEEATQTYRELFSVLGETDRSVETAQHIAKLCENEEQMKAMTDACIGAFALFDDSLPIEGLVEASNETAKTGQLTGVLADALNWAGSSESEFQKKLDTCNDERERTALIIDELISLYGDASEEYKKNNKAVIDATKAQDKLSAATSRWGKAVEPVVTILRNGLAVGIDAAADAFERLIDPAGVAADAIVGTMETSEEAKEKVEELRSKLVELSEVPVVLWTDYHMQQQMELSRALEEAENHYDELVEAERKAAEEAAASAEATASTAEEFSGITEQYVSDATTLLEDFANTYESIYNTVSGWFGLFDKAKTSVKTNVEDMMTAMQSQVEFNNSYSENLQMLKEYGLGGLADAFQSYGAEGSVYAQTIVDAVKQAGGATTEEGQAIIQGFADVNQQVNDSQAELSETMTLMNGEFETELSNLTTAFGEAVVGLDKSAEASKAATTTFNSFLDGMNSKLPEIMEKMQSFGEQITSSLQSGIGSVNIPINFKTRENTGNLVNGSHASGLDYVPFDGYIAELHKGEMVVPADEARMLRNDGTSSMQNEHITSLLTSVLETNQEMLSALIAGQTFKVGEREFARLVRTYA